MSDAESEQGLVRSVRALARNALGLALNRIELAVLELSEARSHALRLLLVGVLGLIAACFAWAAFVGVLVVLAWPSLGWLSLALAAAVHAVLVLICFLHLRSLLKENRLGLPSTMAELRADRDALG